MSVHAHYSMQHPYGGPPRQVTPIARVRASRVRAVGVCACASVWRCLWPPFFLIQLVATGIGLVGVPVGHECCPPTQGQRQHQRHRRACAFLAPRSMCFSALRICVPAPHRGLTTASRCRWSSRSLLLPLRRCRVQKQLRRQRGKAWCSCCVLPCLLAVAGCMCDV